jgi:hypothetical protein
VEPSIRMGMMRVSAAWCASEGRSEGPDIWTA